MPTAMPTRAARPEIGQGIDDFHTPPALAAERLAFFQAHGLEVILQAPYQRPFVHSAFWGRERRVESIRVEIRRDLYMDEATGGKSGSFKGYRRS